MYVHGPKILYEDIGSDMDGRWIEVGRCMSDISFGEYRRMFLYRWISEYVSYFVAMSCQEPSLRFAIYCSVLTFVLQHLGLNLASCSNYP